MIRAMMAKNQTENETVADSKVTKFQVMVNEISSCLFQPQIRGGIFGALFYTPLFSFGENSDAKFYFPACFKNYIN
ncbi:MAG: hypothetical protein IKN12_12055, partial [Selenomonadaceae bacterium]|nr:hypothetical protein [Selenomonadaceae bacterium]